MNVFDPNTLEPKSSASFYMTGNPNPLGNKEYLLENYDSKYFWLMNLDIGDYVTWPLHSNSGVGFHVAGGHSISIVNVKILNCPGVVVLNRCGLGGLYMKNVTATRAEDMPIGATIRPLMAGGGSAVSQVKKGPTIIDSVFEYMYDDIVNDFGAFVPVMKVNKTSNTVTIPISGCALSLDKARLANRTNIGDAISFYDESKSFVGTYTIESVKIATEKYNLMNFALFTFMGMKNKTYDQYWYQGFDVKVSGLPKEYTDLTTSVASYFSDYVASDFYFDNFTARHNTARGFLIKSSNGIIKNCVLEGNRMGGIVLGPEYFWGEAGYTSNITIINNIFINTAIAENYRTAALAIQGPTPDQFDFTIINNTFINCKGPNLILSGCTNVTIQGNRFIDPYRALTKPFPRIFLNFPCSLDDALCIDYNMTKNVSLSDFPSKIIPMNVEQYSPGVWENVDMEKKMGTASKIKIQNGNYTLKKEWRIACSNEIKANTLDFQNSVLKQSAIDKGLLYIANCDNLTISNVVLKFDLNYFPFTQGTIATVSNSNQELRVKVHPGYKPFEPQQRCIIMDRTKKNIKADFTLASTTFDTVANEYILTPNAKSTFTAENDDFVGCKLPAKDNYGIRIVNSTVSFINVTMMSIPGTALFLELLFTQLAPQSCHSSL